MNERKIQYSIECLPEDLEIEGNASAHDPETDARQEQWIRDQLEAGNQWAWCTVRVTAIYPGIQMEGVDYLGGCSYLSEQDFKRGGYYRDMKNEAKADLLRKIEAVKAVTA